MTDNSRRAFLFGAPAVLASAVLPHQAEAQSAINAQDVETLVSEAMDAGRCGRDVVFPDVLKAAVRGMAKKLGRYQEAE